MSSDFATEEDRTGAHRLSFTQCFVGRPFLCPQRLVDRLHPLHQWTRTVISHRLDSSVAGILAVVSQPHPWAQSFTQSLVDPDAPYNEEQLLLVNETDLEKTRELLIMSRRGCIGDADQGRRPAVNPNELASSVENPTFDALCGLVGRPAVTRCCYSIYVKSYSCAD